MQNPTSFHVYNASAGSGKTFTLVKEYLKILVSSSRPKRFQTILAITFTNKAAAEMKERILNNLRDFSSPNILTNKSEMFKILEQETLVQDTVLHNRSIKVLQSILNNYSAFNITTIDSFTYRLIRNFAFDLGLSMNFDVEMDVKSLLNEAVESLISKIGEDEKLTKLLIDFSLEKASEDKSWDISRELKEIAQILLKENDLLHVQYLKEKSIEDFIVLKKELKLKLKESDKILKQIGLSSLERINDAGLVPENFTRKTLPNFLQDLSVFSSKFDFSKRSATIEKAIENHNFYTKNAEKEVKNSIENILPQIIELFNKAKKAYGQKSLYELFLKNIIPLAVLNSINQSLEELKEEKNIHLNAEFNQIISEHLREQPTAFIYERIGEKFKHFFIDEMQDTSKLQWQNLIPLISNALSQENASLLLVGDAKQSIYRWRGGEAEQFIGLSSDENPFYIDKSVSRLEINHRSYSEIVDFNNDFFQFVAKQFHKNTYSQIYFKENNQKRTDKVGGYVQLSFLEEGLLAADKDILYAERTVQIITDLKNDFDLGEVCILTRTRKQGVNIANYLTERGIPIISSETLLLNNSAKVRFITDLLTYLSQSDHKEAQLEVLYFLYEHLGVQKEKHDFLEEFIGHTQEVFFQKLSDYTIDFEYSNFEQLPFYESIEYVVRAFQLNKTADAYVLFFLDEVLQFSIKKSEGASGFLEYWNEKKENLSIVVPEAKNAVRIMTIHKAKGLEFPVVIFPYDLDIYREINPKTWYPIQDKNEFNDFESLLVNANKSLEQVSEFGTSLYQERRNELELDNINLLYVSLTRAVEHLYIISEKRKLVDTPKWFSQFFMQFLKEHQYFQEDLMVYEFGSKERVSEREGVNRKSIDLQDFISASWQDHNITIVASSSLLWDSEKGATIAYGNLIHEILSKINSPLDIEQVILEYINKGALSQEEANTIFKKITEVVTHKKLRNYFSNNYTSYNERELLTSHNEIVKPDRFLVDESGNAILIDYKTGKVDKKHEQQLIIYQDALESIGFKVSEKTLVYIGDDIVVQAC